MIVGIGTDIVEIERINHVFQKHGQQFLKKLMSKEEIAVKEKWTKTDIAKRFCAKEAVSKALGTGFSKGITMPEICIKHDKQGKPLIKLIGKAKKQYLLLKGNNIQISISDEKNNAIAFCIIESCL